MATITRRVDDLDGTEETPDVPVRAVFFAYQDANTQEITAYTVDLKRDNAAKFAKAIAPFIKVATVVTMPSAPKPARADRSEATAKREWAAKQRNTDGTARWPNLPERGRLPDEVSNAYAAYLKTQTNTDTDTESANTDSSEPGNADGSSDTEPSNGGDALSAEA